MERSMSDELFDRAIDDAARTLTEGELPAGFRATVIQRIETRPRYRLRWVFAYVALASALLLALRVGFREHSATEQPRPATKASLQSSVGADGRRTASTVTPEQTPQHVSTKSSGAARFVRERLPVGESPVEALAPEPLEVEGIAMSALGPGESIRVTELQPVQPITIAPMDVLEGDRP
jgi:hypothetical protein